MKTTAHFQKACEGSTERAEPRQTKPPVVCGHLLSPVEYLVGAVAGCWFGVAVLDGLQLGRGRWSESFFVVVGRDWRASFDKDYQRTKWRQTGVS